MAKTFALKNGYRVDADQEMFAYGACSADYNYGIVHYRLKHLFVIIFGKII